MMSFAILELNESINALTQVNATVGQLVILTRMLEMELNNLSNQVMQLRTECSNNNIPATICESIPNVSYRVNVDYTVVSWLINH